MENVNLYEIKKNQTNFAQVTITGSQSAEQFIRQFYSDDIEV